MLSYPEVSSPPERQHDESVLYSSFKIVLEPTLVAVTTYES